MIRIIRQSKMVYAAFLCISFVNVAWGGNMKHVNFWTFVDNMKVNLIKTQDEMMRSFGNPLLLEHETAHTRFFIGGGFPLQDGIKIDSVDLRVSKDTAPTPAFLSFEVSGKCISREDVHKKYKGLVLSGMPTGRSLEETTSFSSNPDEKGLFVTFSFSEAKPDCLKRVIFDSK